MNSESRNSETWASRLENWPPSRRNLLGQSSRNGTSSPSLPLGGSSTRRSTPVSHLVAAQAHTWAIPSMYYKLTAHVLDWYEAGPSHTSADARQIWRSCADWSKYGIIQQSRSCTHCLSHENRISEGMAIMLSTILLERLLG